MTAGPPQVRSPRPGRQGGGTVEVHSTKSAPAETINPAAVEGIDSVRPIRDEVRTRVEGLLADLIPAA